VAISCVVLGAIVYLVLAATVFAPVDEHGARTVHLTIHSRAVGEDLGVNVVEPARLPEPGQRSLLVFLHGRGGSDATFTEDEAVFRGLARLGARAPVLAFPDGGDHGYWHDRAEGDWGRYVMREVIPTVSRRFGIDPRRIAIGGISMGGFGAYDLALLHPGRFCAVGGHSPALWFSGADSAPGAFDDAEDYARHDIVNHPPRYSAPVWIDVGTDDPFHNAAVHYAHQIHAQLHVWPGGHDSGYWHSHMRQYLAFYARHCA
jgi:S-formylglutathione hydrolase FrmB